MNASHVLPEFFIFYRSPQSVREKQENKDIIARVDYERRGSQSKKQAIISAIHEIFKTAIAIMSQQLALEFAQDSNA